MMYLPVNHITTKEGVELVLHGGERFSAISKSINKKFIICKCASIYYLLYAMVSICHSFITSKWLTTLHPINKMDGLSGMATSQVRSYIISRFSVLDCTPIKVYNRFSSGIYQRYKYEINCMRIGDFACMMDG
jgi:hypothetical protein